MSQTCHSPTERTGIRNAGPMRTRLAAAAVAAAALLTLTACSSSGDKAAPALTTSAASAAAATSSPAPTAGDQLKTAVRAYSAAYFKPDAKTGYSMMSTRCKATVNEDIFGLEVAGAAKNYGRQPVKTITVDQLSGNLARVSYTYAVPMLNQSAQPWVRERGQWRYDAC